MKSDSLTNLPGTRIRAFWQKGQVLALGLALFATTATAGTPFSRIYTFGDSLSDTGNFFQMTGGIVPPPPYYNGRVSNGPIWIEKLASDLGMELAPEDQFAILGATTGYDNFRDGVLGLEYPGFLDQIDNFFALHGPAPLDPDALYVVWIGANDFFDWLENDLGNPALVPALIGNGVARTAASILRLAQGGARHILVVNVPDLGLLPSTLALGPQIASDLSALSDAYNATLEQQLDALAMAGIPTIRIDSAGIIRAMVSDPAAFGLTNVTAPALFGGLDPDTALFWDGVHPTEAAHAVVAANALHRMIEFYSPRKGKGRAPGPVQSLNGLTKGSRRR